MAATASVKDDAQQIEFRSVRLADLETRLDDDSDGEFAGYACRFNVVDTYNTTFASGCWRSGGLDDGTYALLSMHDEKAVIGAFTATEDETGLFIRGKYDPTPEGQAARARAKSGSAAELSVGFVRTGVDPADPDRITGARLYEVSSITARMASQRGAGLTMIRAAVDSRLANEPAGEDDDAAIGIDERTAKPTCRSCGRGVRRFICARCLHDGVKGRTVDPEGRSHNMEIEQRAYTTVAGSYEERMELVSRSAGGWALTRYGVEVSIGLEATFSDVVVFTARSWESDAPAELQSGETWRAQYLINDEGTVTMGEPVAAELVTVVRSHNEALEVRTEGAADGEAPNGNGEEDLQESAPDAEAQIPAEAAQPADAEPEATEPATAPDNGIVDEPGDEAETPAEEPEPEVDENAKAEEERVRRLKLRLRFMNALAR